MTELVPRGEYPAACLTGLHVLLVDDSIDALHAFAELLEMEGAQVVTAQSGAEALSVASGTHHFDLLISDISMPDMNGHEMLAALRARASTAHVPAIALTGFGAAADPMRDETVRGFDKYLGKPVMFDTLIETIQALAPVRAKPQ
jgi:two-component system CheB/CheR fusion protein